MKENISCVLIHNLSYFFLYSTILKISSVCENTAYSSPNKEVFEKSSIPRENQLYDDPELPQQLRPYTLQGSKYFVE